MYEVFMQLLQKYGVSSYEVAKRAGVTQTALSNWKSGRSTPKAETMRKIADYFGVTVDYLMTGEETMIASEPQIKTVSERDIAKKIDEIIGEMNDPDTSPLYFNGKKIDDKSLEMLAFALENALKQVEMMTDEKKK